MMKKNFPIFLLFWSVMWATALLVPMFISICEAEEVILSWWVSTAPDLQGYAVYQSRGSSGPPYELIDLLPIEDLVDSNHPEVIISDLENFTKYYFAVTAYDTEGNESCFSNEVCVEITESSTLDCSPGKSSGGGSGGGGCFIFMASKRFW
jgi:hypothetical protein